MAELNRAGRARVALGVTFLVGAAVAVTLGVVGAQQTVPRVLPVGWFTSMQSMKAWLATVVLLMVVGQVISASWMYGWLPRAPRHPGWLPAVHRVSGFLAFLISLPIGFYCLYGFGFDTITPRTFAHSVAGCAFYGAFASKMVGLRMASLPSWVIPALGGTVFAALVVAWYLSAWWWFQLFGYAR